MERAAAAGVIWFFFTGYCRAVGVPFDDTVQYGTAIGGILGSAGFQLWQSWKR